MAMKLVDGINTEHSHADELEYALRQLGSMDTIVTDQQSRPIKRVRLFEQTLTDGSKVNVIELEFDNDAVWKSPELSH